MRNKHEILLALLSKNSQGSHFAMGVTSQDEVKLIARSEVTGDNDPRTAIVNLLQQSKARKVPAIRRVYSTHAPTPACLGMMQLLGIESVFYLDGTLQRINFFQNSAVPTLGKSVGVNRGLVADDVPVQASAPDVDTYAEGYYEWFQATAREKRRALLQTWMPPDRHGRCKIYETFRTALGDVVGARQPAVMAHVPLQTNAAGARREYLDDVFMCGAYLLAAKLWVADSVPPLPGIQSRELSPTPISKGFNIACLIADKAGTILAWGVNRADSGTDHAETSAILSYIAAGHDVLPSDATLYTTLQSCVMCAGMFVHAGGQRCIYGQVDPNMDNSTALNTGDYRPAGEIAADKVGLSFLVDRTAPTESSNVMKLGPWEVINPKPKKKLIQPVEHRVPPGLDGAMSRETRGVRGLNTPKFLKSFSSAKEFSRANEWFLALGLEAMNEAEDRAWNGINQFLGRFRFRQQESA